MHVNNPGILYLLLLLPFLAWYQWRKKHRTPVRYSSVSLLPSAGKTWRQHLLPTPAVCRYLAFAALIAARLEAQGRDRGLAAGALDVQLGEERIEVWDLLAVDFDDALRGLAIARVD